MCFFAILGILPRERVIGREMRFCRFCNRETVQQVVERRMWFTFFFIPLFPVSRKQIVYRCQSCGLEEGAGLHIHDERHEYQQQTVTPAGHGTKICPNCGAEVIEEAAYCQFCGHKFW